jgi:DNA-binding response OmpR family regulator
VGKKGRTFLVASTDEPVCEILARVVETAGFEAVRLDVGIDVVDAMVVAGAHGLLLDLGSHNQATLEALRARPESGPADAKVIVIGTGPAGGRLAWGAGADGFLVRPFPATELEATLREIVGLDPEQRQARRDAASEALAR